MAFIKVTDNILEVRPLDESIPSLSKFIGDEMGYYLYTLKDTWIFPFKRTKIKLNISSITLPDNAIGIIGGKWACYDVETIMASYKKDFNEVTIVSRKFLPFKLKKSTSVAIMSIVPVMECHLIEHKNSIEK